MFIWAYDEKLENDMRGSGFQSAFPFHNIPGAFEHFVERAFPAVLFIHFLCGAIHTDDDPAQAGFDGPARIFVIEKMAICGSDRVNSLLPCIRDHIKEFRVDVWFALEIEDEPCEVCRELVDRFTKEIVFQISGGSGECAKATRAFRAAKIARCGGFNRDGHRHSPLDGAAEPFCELIGCIHLKDVPETLWSEARKEMNCIVSMQHGSDRKVSDVQRKSTEPATAD
jgi:hypothetical protein